ncbi:hypothetical protein MCEGE10_00262 [Flavobacteriaceae bacterium]
MKQPDVLNKKKVYPITNELNTYLEKYERITKTRIFYEDLLRFQGSVVVYDKEGEDTLWLSVYYSESDRTEIEASLNKIYTLLHSDGDESTLPFLTVDAIDFCTFGNSKPFRVKVRNILNDNFTHFYIKKADASRIYGLELEHILSPNRINFLVYKDTLIEEHIIGIPGDVFLKKNLPKCTEPEKAQIAKEFVKFNERCMVGLLGDMRSYNYVVIPIHDFDHVVYRIRAIDFDQQSYEGNFKFYKPQFFVENIKMVQLVSSKLLPNSIEQYKKEEHSLMVKRLVGSEKRLIDLLKAMKSDDISPKENVILLRKEIFEFTRDLKYKNAETMGEIIEVTVNFLKRKYKSHLNY